MPPSPGPSEPPDSASTLPLSGVQVTLAIPLYAKALDFRSRRSILHDRTADAIVRSLDFDFERVRSRGTGRLIVIRSRLIDDWVRAELARNPGTIVVNLGCGLDARITRVDPPRTVRWFDLDFPEVIAVRRRYYSDRPGYTMVPGSITESGWSDRIPTDGPVLATAEGVFEYLTREEVAGVLRTFTGRFARGALVFDVMNSFALTMGNSRLPARTGATLRWAVDDLAELDALDPRCHPTALARPMASDLLPFGARVAFALSGLSRRARDAVRIVRLDFGPG